MKKSQLVSAIKNVLAENKKEKLNENTIREIIREVLSEKQNINEEAYDTIRDIINNHGNRPSEEEVRANLTGNDDDEVLKHFGYSSGTVIGYQYGRPIYANQKKKETNWKYSGGGYGRKRYE